MKRTAGAMMLLAALGGCISTEHGPNMADTSPGGWNGHSTIPGAVGPWGQPVPFNPAAVAGMPTPAAGTAAGAPGGVIDARYTGIDNLHPAAADGGIVKANYNPPPQLPNVAGMNGMGALVANAGAGMPMGPMAPMNKRTEVRFVGPSGMKISWFVPAGEGKGAFSPSFLTAPARYNFLQGALYRLKLSDIVNRPGLELYPTLEVVPSGPRSDAFLAHSAVPITFTDEDLDQVAAGNFVVKVIYLPDAQYQDLATAGPDEVVSSRLEPGVDPLAEAHRRGNILLVVRLGNIDLEAPNTPAMDAPISGGKVGMRGPSNGPRPLSPAQVKVAADVNVTNVDSRPGFANASSSGKSATTAVRADQKVDTSANWWSNPDSSKK